MKYRICIAGSRTFNDCQMLQTKCDEIINKIIDESYEAPDDIRIVSGHANGADKLGERYAIECHYGLELFPAKWDQYGKSAGFRRNIEMRDYINSHYGNNKGVLIAFWDGTSSGTKHMIDTCKSQDNIEVYVIRY